MIVELLSKYDVPKIYYLTDGKVGKVLVEIFYTTFRIAILIYFQFNSNVFDGLHKQYFFNCYYGVPKVFATFYHSN